MPLDEISELLDKERLVFQRCKEKSLPQEKNKNINYVSRLLLAILDSVTQWSIKLYSWHRNYFETRNLKHEGKIKIFLEMQTSERIAYRSTITK